MDELPEVPNEFPRITPKQIGLDVIAILNFDRGVLFTLRGLILNPFKAIQSYLYGNRRQHAHPIRILVFSSALAAFLTINIVGLQGTNVSVNDPVKIESESTAPGDHDAAEANPEETNAAEAQLKEDVNGFIEKYLNLFFISTVPIMALLCWGYYWRKGYNLAEHFVINCFLASVGNTFSIVFALMSLAWKPIMLIGTGIASIYYIYAMMSVYQNNSFWGFIKTVVIIGLYGILVLALTMGGLFFFLYHWGENYGIPIGN